MNEKKLDSGKLNEVNGGAFRVPIQDKNVISKQAVCSQCRHDLVYQPPRIMGGVQQNAVLVCTNPDCPNFQKEQIVFVNVNKKL